MRDWNQYLATGPFDLYELHLFHLVVRHGSFTRAAEAAGLTQSAVTRQIQAMENSLGLDLLERTTRRVRMTPAGEFLHRESLRMLGDVDALLARMREEFAGGRKQVRVGVSQTVGLAYLPGFFHANLRRAPEVACRVLLQSSADIVAALQGNDLDLGVISRGTRLPGNLLVTHRFKDAFCLIAPARDRENESPPSSLRRREFARWSAGQSWLLLSDASNTGRRLRQWIRGCGWKLEPAMELDSFDLIINLVALGMGASFVPVRALALYNQKKTLQRITFPDRFERELLVVRRRQRRPVPHLAAFIENILF
ncbi:MAG: LysR family transcriptional regulator [Verrucomicrobiae bacterium]|nr:LysR family transcriptional regulator [Verrucomicrobiae bacterium]